MKNLIVFFLLGLFEIGHTQGLLNNLRGCYTMDCYAGAGLPGANSATTGSSYNGILFGNVTCVAGHNSAASTAFQYGGASTDHIDIPNPTLIKSTNEVTFSGWYKVNSLGGQNFISLVYTECGSTGVSWAPAWDLNVQQASANNIRFGCNRWGYSFMSSIPITLNTWYHVVVYWSSTKGRIWVNNVKDSLTVSNTPITYGANSPVILGSNNTVNWTSTFSGAIDNLRFYDRALTSAEITDLYNNDPNCSSAGANVPPPPPPPSSSCCLGNKCSVAANPISGDYEIPLANFNFNFTAPQNSISKVIIGRTTCATGPARLVIGDDNIGNGIYSTCSTASGNNIAVRGYANDPNANTSVSTFGVLGESNLSNGNTSALSAGIAGFCGTMNAALLPPGENIGVYGNSISNNGAWAGYFDGDVQFNGTVWGSQHVWVSDKRFKDEIKVIGNVNEKLKNISGYTYVYKTDEFKNKNFPKAEQIGFIAQELQEVFPQLIVEDKNGYLGVNYVGFIPVLLQAHKEQQIQIDKQQHQIEELKSLVQSIAGLPAANKKGISTTAVELSDKNAIVLDQNAPNPFAESTVINYFIPSDFSKAQILFSTNEGKLIKVVDLTEKGAGSLNVFANDLTHGIYTYTLVVDGKTIDSKKMIKE